MDDSPWSTPVDLPAVEWVRRHLRSTVTLGAILAHLRFLLPVLQYDRPPMRTDAALFEHAGWHVLRGGRLYLDVWDPKPPLPYETTAVTALLTGSPGGQHAVTVVLTVVASVGTVALVASLARRLTGRTDAALLAGGAMLAIPAYTYFPAFGFNAKYFVAFTGLLAIHLALDGRAIASGVAAAASVGYWHLAAVVPILTVGIVARRQSWRVVGLVCLGGGLAAAVILAPVVYWGALDAMFAETVVIPIVVPEPGHRLFGLGSGSRVLVALAVTGVGFALALRRFVQPDPEKWWVVAGIAWFWFVALGIDYDYYSDSFLLLAFVALGVALAYADRPRVRPYLAGVVGFWVLVLFVSPDAFGLLDLAPEMTPPAPLSEIHPSPIPGDGTVADVKVLFWERRIPGTCHYRMSALERRWLTLAGYEGTCGRLGDAIRLLLR